MNSNKFLHREKYIRIGGVLLLLSPIFNFLMSFAVTHNTSRGWSFAILWILLRSMTWTSWGLSLSSMIVGATMLKGRRSTWAFVLLVLGFYVIWDCVHFTRDARDSGYIQPILALAINCGLFGLVYLQEFHQQMYGVPTAKTPEPAPTTATPAQVLQMPVTKPMETPSTAAAAAPAPTREPCALILKALGHGPASLVFQNKKFVCKVSMELTRKD
jgi:hypothetical protein